MTTQNWIVTIGVITLVIERIIRWIFRFIRPEKELDKIAMDMVKLHSKSVNEGWDSTPLALFYLYKIGLKKQKQRYNEEFVEFLQNKEIEITRKLEHSEETLNRNFSIMFEVECILLELEQKDKLPPELRSFLADVKTFQQKYGQYIEPRKAKIKEVAAKIFRRLKRNKS